MSAPDAAADHDDALADAIAIASAVRTADTEALAAVLRNCDLAEVTVTLGKLVAEAARESRATPERFRWWAEHAAGRP